MLTNALGIGDEVKVSTFVVPLADGDRFMLCSDGVSEYVPEAEVGEVLTKAASPVRAAQKLIDLALERGGGDNATAVVVRVLEAGDSPQPADQRKKDDAAIARCALWGKKVTPQQRLRALRIAIPRDHAVGDKLPAHTLGDRVAWIVIEGEVVQDGIVLGPGAILYPESLTLTPVGDPPPLPERDALAVVRSEVRALALRADDFRELCEDDGELGEALLDGLAGAIAKAKKPRPQLKIGPRRCRGPWTHLAPSTRAARPIRTCRSPSASSPSRTRTAIRTSRSRAWRSTPRCRARSPTTPAIARRPCPTIRRAGAAGRRRAR
jgi:hypothetical protein